MGISNDLAYFEQRLKLLIITYDQYFRGLEKREPLKLSDEVENMALRLSKRASPNTALRFNRDRLLTVYNIHKQRWIHAARKFG